MTPRHWRHSNCARCANVTNERFFSGASLVPFRRPGQPRKANITAGLASASLCIVDEADRRAWRVHTLLLTTSFSRRIAELDRLVLVLEVVFLAGIVGPVARGKRRHLGHHVCNLPIRFGLRSGQHGPSFSPWLAPHFEVCDSRVNSVRLHRSPSGCPAPAHGRRHRHRMRTSSRP